MKICIFGLGYVGCVSLGCLAKMGHDVIGVDILKEKVDLVNLGIPTIVEKEIDIIIKEQFSIGKIRATMDPIDAILNSDLSIICVGTPSSATGHLDLSHIYSAAEQIGTALKQKNGKHIILIRSTVIPGTNKTVTEIIENSSGKTAGKDFSVVSNPEFLREGSAVQDYFNPSTTIIGGEDINAVEVVKSLYENLPGQIEIVSVRVAEIIKYVNNSYHALKITFANEIGTICEKLKIDSHEVMDLFCKDTKLNISPAYFKPGFAYGGSCLPKDLKALNSIAHDNYLKSPVLSAIEGSNEFHKQKILELILKLGGDTIGFMGLSFKEGTDDLRYSPSVELIESLIGKGKKIIIYDENVQLSRLVGQNKSYINQKFPHFSALFIENPQLLIFNSDLLVFPHKVNFLSELVIPVDKAILDLSRIEELVGHPNYHGLSW